MNIFYLDHNPNICAKYHCDKHVVKMILEYAQLLSTAHRFLDKDDVQNSDKLYRATHINHPCSKWVRSSQKNYLWLTDLFVALCHEYTFRYGKEHKTSNLISCLLATPKNICDIDFCQPPQAMPEEYKCSSSIDAYREYYRKDKSRFAKWTKRDCPVWFINK